MPFNRSGCRPELLQRCPRSGGLRGPLAGTAGRLAITVFRLGKAKDDFQAQQAEHASQSASGFSRVAPAGSNMLHDVSSGGRASEGRPLRERQAAHQSMPFKCV